MSSPGSHLSVVASPGDTGTVRGLAGDYGIGAIISRHKWCLTKGMPIHLGATEGAWSGPLSPRSQEMPMSPGRQ